MNLGENIHNAFVVVFETLKSIEKLMIRCRTEIDQDKYYMPEERFMRYSSDLTWEGWSGIFPVGLPDVPRRITTCSTVPSMQRICM